MTGFVIGCAAMVLAALAWITLPLLRTNAVDAASSRVERRTSTLIVTVAISALAVFMYAGLTTWNWRAVETAQTQAANVDSMLKQLEDKLATHPEDLQGWLLLGRSYVALQRFSLGATAYQHAYDLSGGENVDAVVGLGEALALLDQNSLSGRAGELFDAALAKAPNNPKALWYGSVAALQKGDLRLGRDRLQALLVQNPPDELRAMLERQIQDLNEQLGETGEGVRAGASAPAAQGRVVSVAITIAPAIQQQLKGTTPLFVLARDPAAPGPPLAVQRHSSNEAPLTVQLSEADAMIPTRSIATVPRVKIVARLSRSGAPQERTGDFFGEADYDFGKDKGPLQIVIDRTVP
ncbi:MAG: tetratricopeptide repeat protein [Povalibacter sp.]